MPRYRTTSAPDDLTDSMRECARASRCSDPRIETANGKTTRWPALTPRAFCDSCRGVIARALDDLPMLFVRVHMELGGSQQASGGPVVSVSKSAPVPLSLQADELIRLILATLVSWEERVRTVARLSELDTATSRRRRDGVILTQAWTILAAHLDALLALEPEPMVRDGELVELGGADAGLDVLYLAWRCQALLTETTKAARHLEGIPCSCGFCELYEILIDGQFAGANCRQCGADYTAQTYKDLTDEQAEPVRKSGVRRRSLLVTAGDDTTARRA
ncbi:hypothetical protein AB0J28_01990 [Streptosporangium canum]|uniref:hypothetical protein n=1 Tax=Streptosporangium canum TaxID=324952 RepID=UPI003437A40A